MLGGKRTPSSGSRIRCGESAFVIILRRAGAGWGAGPLLSVLPRRPPMDSPTFAGHIDRRWAILPVLLVAERDPVVRELRRRVVERLVAREGGRGHRVYRSETCPTGS
jgi:hypothetical protein